MRNPLLLKILTEARLAQEPPDPSTHYVGVRLSAGSRTTLLKHIKPEHANTNAEHVTLISHPTEQDLQKIQRHVGRQVTFHATHHANDSDEKVQAVRVRGLDHLSDKPHKHVTVSTGHGVSAARSNDLLAREQGERLSRWIPLSGTVEITKREGRG